MSDQQQVTMPPLVPSLVVRDPRATLEWFGKLGFSTVMEMPAPDGTIVHAEVRRGDGVHLMLGPAMGLHTPGSSGMSLYISLNESVDALHDQAVAGGLTVSEGLTDQFWGDRTFMVEHPDGYRIMFSQHVRDVSMEEMAQAAAEFSAQPVGD